MSSDNFKERVTSIVKDQSEELGIPIDDIKCLSTTSFPNTVAVTSKINGEKHGFQIQESQNSSNYKSITADKIERHLRLIKEELETHVEVNDHRLIFNETHGLEINAALSPVSWHFTTEKRPEKHPHILTDEGEIPPPAQTRYVPQGLDDETKDKMKAYIIGWALENDPKNWIVKNKNFAHPEKI